MIDLDNSGLPLVLAKGSSLDKHISSDLRPIMRRISDKTILVSIDGGIPDWALEM